MRVRVPSPEIDDPHLLIGGGDGDGRITVLDGGGDGVGPREGRPRGEAVSQ